MPRRPIDSRLLTDVPRRAVFLLAYPVLLEQILSFLVGFYDTFLSGRISTEATSVVGVSAYVDWLASMMFGLVGTGTTALVSRAIGAGNDDEARIVANRSLALAVILGTIISAAIALCAGVFADLLAMEGTARELTIRYLRINAVGTLFTSVTLVGAAALRGAGDVKTPMYVLGSVNIINMAVSTFLVFGLGPWFPQSWNPDLGIDGIVGGTVVARCAGAAMMLGALARGRGPIHLSPGELWPRGPVVGRILRIGVPAAIDGAIMWGGQFLFLMLVARLAAGEMGQAIFAAHIIAIRVEAITYLPAVAWGTAAATLVGQALGAGNPQRAIQCGHEAVRQCSLFALVITLIFVLGAGPIFRLMHDDPAVGAVGTNPFRMVGLFQITLVIAIVYVSALRGAGDTRYPLMATAFSVLLVRLPVAYVAGIVLDLGLLGAWIGMCADMSTRAILVAWRYHHGDWTKTVV